MADRKNCMLAFAALFFFASQLHAQTTQPDWQTVQGGQLILKPFSSAPYPHPSRDQGYKASNGTFYPKAGHYDDSTIGIYLPPAFHPDGAINFVVHFHGHNNHVSKVFDDYDLIREMNGSGVNAALVVPQGPHDVPDSGCGKLELDPQGFAHLITDIAQFLVAEKKSPVATIGHITLSAHSGGYKVTASILDHGGLAANITDVCLLDASYGQLEWFSAWCAASPAHRLISFHTKHLDDANVELQGLLTKASVPFTLLEESKFSPQAITPRGVYFISTTLAHNDVLAKKHYFQICIQSSDWSIP